MQLLILAFIEFYIFFCWYWAKSFCFYCFGSDFWVWPKQNKDIAKS